MFFIAIFYSVNSENMNYWISIFFFCLVFIRCGVFYNYYNLKTTKVLTDSVSVTYKEFDGIPLVPFQMNSSTSDRNFLFDVGATTSILFKSILQDGLIEHVGGTPIIDLNKQLIWATYKGINTLKINKNPILKNVNGLFLNQVNPLISCVSDGAIGIEHIKKYVWRFSKKNNVLTVAPNIGFFKQELYKYYKVNLQKNILTGQYYLFIYVKNKKIKILFDTGVSGGDIISLTKKSFNKIYAQEKPTTIFTLNKSGTSWKNNSGQDLYDSSISIKSSYILNGMHIDGVQFMHSSDPTMNIMGPNSFHYQNIIYDLKNKAIYFTYSPETTNNDLLVLKQIGFGIAYDFNTNVYYISEIVKEHNLSEIKLGDEVLSINNQDFNNKINGCFFAKNNKEFFMPIIQNILKFNRIELTLRRKSNQIDSIFNVVIRYKQ